jgi:hypothetical protein
LQHSENQLRRHYWRPDDSWFCGLIKVSSD